MIIFGIVIFVVAFFIHDIAKALANARRDDTGNTPLHQWAVQKPDRFAWYLGGDPYKDKQGWFWTCDFWHLFDGHIRVWMVWMGGIGGGLACWFVALENPFWDMLVFNPLWLLPIGWIAYWIAGELFKYLYHVIFMGDWTREKFWQEMSL